MLAELHCHTRASNKKRKFLESPNSPHEMVEAAARNGLGAIAITDHNSVDGINEARKAGKKLGIIIIPGCEISTAKGHILALGTAETIPEGLSVEETVDIIHSDGGIAVAAHPFDVRGAGIRKESLKCDVMEVFNALNTERISNWKAVSFAMKKGIHGIASSDVHRADMLGYGYVIFDQNICSADHIIKAIKKGKFAIRSRYIPHSIVASWNRCRLEDFFGNNLAILSIPSFWPFTLGQLAYRTFRIGVGI